MKTKRKEKEKKEEKKRSEEGDAQNKTRALRRSGRKSYH